jgi:hypothetical protein
LGNAYACPYIFVSLFLLLLKSYAALTEVLFFATARGKISVRTQQNFCAHGNIFLCARSKTSVRTQQNFRAHRNLPLSVMCQKDVQTWQDMKPLFLLEK